MKPVIILLGLVIIAGLLAYVSLTGVRSVVEPSISCDNRKYSDEDLDNAALDILYARIPHLTRPYKQEDINAARVNLNQLRDWVKTIQPEKVRLAYGRWIDYYLGECDEKESELNRPENADQAERDRSSKDYTDGMLRASELAKCLPKPE